MQTLFNVFNHYETRYAWDTMNSYSNHSQHKIKLHTLCVNCLVILQCDMHEACRIHNLPLPTQHVASCHLAGRIVDPSSMVNTSFSLSKRTKKKISDCTTAFNVVLSWKFINGHQIHNSPLTFFNKRPFYFSHVLPQISACILLYFHHSPITRHPIQLWQRTPSQADINIQFRRC